MQELVVLLSSIAGVASAVAIKRFPKDRTRLQSIGASSHIKHKINSLKIEKDILNKTIARLYEDDSSLTRIQKDRLQLRYQHQLGVILARLEKLEVAKRHPDLGPVGDGLITLMDQKLSQLDNRLYELSAKITAVADPQIKEQKKTESSDVKSNPIKIMQETFKFDGRQKNQTITMVDVPKPQKRPMEITTLTTISKNISKYPFEQESKIVSQNIEKMTSPKGTVTEKEEILQNSIQITRPQIKIPDANEELPLPKALPRPQETKEISKTAITSDKTDDDDDDDLEKIKGEIMKTLSKLEQAEVE